MKMKVSNFNYTLILDKQAKILMAYDGKGNLKHL